MATVTTATRPQPPAGAAHRRQVGDRIFAGLSAAAAVSLVATVLLFAIVFAVGSWHSIVHNGVAFFTSFNWPSNGFDDPTFGALNYIYGTLITSAIALLIGGLASLGAAIFLAEYAPAWLRTPLSFLVELLAAVPSIVYGFWGVQFLSQLMGGPAGVERTLHRLLGWLPLFADKVTTVNGNTFNVAFDGRDILVASLVLAVMIIPTIAAISRDVIHAVPASQREGMLALGATKWEGVRKVVLPAAKRGIIGAVILGLGRALGETVAVAFLIGGASSAVGPQPTVLHHGETIASKFANNYNEISPADVNGYAAFLELGLVLFVITVLINGLARWLVARSAPAAGRHHTPLARVGRFAGLLAVPFFALLASPFFTTAGSLLLIALWGVRRGLQAWKPGARRANWFAFLTNPSQSLGYRMFLDTCMQWLFVLALLVAIVPLGLIFFLVVTKGLPVLLHPGFLTHDTSGRPLFGDVPTPHVGIAQGILGTGALVGLASLLGIPIGLLAGIFLAEYGDNPLGRAVRFTADVLQGVPSIIMGLFVLTVAINRSWFVADQKYNGWAGALALAIMMLPIISRTTEEILRLVPDTLREASLALGEPKWRSIMTVIFPAALSGIVTGVLLGVARIAGETAPILLTVRGNDSFTGLSDQTPALPLLMYNYGRRPDSAALDLSWGAALVLLVIVLLLAFGLRFLLRDRTRAVL